MFFFKQKTAYEMRISDWSSDVCSSDLRLDAAATVERYAPALERIYRVLLERFTEASGALNKRIADAVGPLPEWASARVATAFVTFAFTDLTLYPMMNVLGVKIGRASCRARVCQYG